MPCERISVQNRRFRGPVDRTFQVEGVAPYQPFFFSENSAKRWYKNLDRFLFSFVPICAFDRRTERRTGRRTDTFPIASPRWHSMQRGKNRCKKFRLLASAKISHNCTHFSFVQEINKFFCMNSGFSGFVNSNMLLF